MSPAVHGVSRPTTKRMVRLSATHDHKMLSVSDRILWLSDGPHSHRASTRSQILPDPCRPDQVTAGGEVRPFNEAHEFFGVGVGIVDQVQTGIDHLTQVVRGDIGGHPHRETLEEIHALLRAQLHDSRGDHAVVHGGPDIVRRGRGVHVDAQLRIHREPRPHLLLGARHSVVTVEPDVLEKYLIRGQRRVLPDGLRDRGE